MQSRTEETTAEWRALAKVDPYFVIATRPGKEGAWTPEEFYAEGREDWRRFHHHWEHFAPGLSGHCLEIGCGAGRVTHALAGDFARVTAVDVSRDMLDLAAGAVPSNVDLVQVDGTTLTLEDGAIDHAFTCHVLQHLEGLDVVADYLGEVRRVLRPGGTIMVQLGLVGAPLPWHARVRQELGLRRARRANARGAGEATFRVRLYPREQILALLERLGFADVELRVFEAPASHEINAFWLARRT